MDSKHRHELEKNELVKWFSAQYEDWIKPNSSWLGYAVLGGLIIVCIVIGTSRVHTWNTNAAWKQYHAALHSVHSETELELVAQSTSGIIGSQARLALAQRQLESGCEQVLIDKGQAITLLEKAVSSFQHVQRTTSDPMLLQQAGFGLGLAWESLAAARIGDDIAKAEEAYKKVIVHWGDGFMAERAQRQLALIRQPTTKMFLELTAAKVAETPEQEAFLEGMGMEGLSFGDSITPDGQIDLSPFDVPADEETADEEPADTVGGSLMLLFFCRC